MNSRDIPKLFENFIATYDADAKNAIWQSHSQRFRECWDHRIMTSGTDELNDAEIDEIVRILDSKGEGNTSADEAVAKAMIPQGVWRRLFKEILRRLANCARS